MLSTRGYPVTSNYHLVATDQPAPLEVEDTDVNAIFEVALKHISDEAEQITGQVNVSPSEDQKNILLQKQRCMDNLRNAIQGLQKAVMADTTLPNEEAKSIALSTKNLAEVAVSPNTTAADLSKAVDNFCQVTNPISKTRIALAVALGIVCIASFLLLPWTAPLLLKAIGTFAGCLVAGGQLLIGMASEIGAMEALTPKFFRPRLQVVKKVEMLSEHYSNRRLGG